LDTEPSVNTAEGKAITIRTPNFGELRVPNEKVIRFPEGIPGFAQIHQFTVVELENIRPFQYLQALGDPPVALLVVNPFLFVPSYRFDLSASDMEDIQSDTTEGLSVFAVATVPSNPAEATINLLAPIVINFKQRCGKQVILLEGSYSVRHPLVAAGPGAPGGEGQ